MDAYFKDRLKTLCGYGALGDFADAAGIHPVNLSRQIAKGEVDRTLTGYLEWMEATPPTKWPARWAKLAERAKAKAKSDHKKAQVA